MALIGKNIRKIRSVKQLSQQAFADLFGVSRASVGSYEEGRADPKIDTIIAIANYFSITLEEFLTKELTVNDLYHFDVFKAKLGKEKKPNTKKPNENEMPLVTAKLRDEYIKKHQNKDFLMDLPSIMLPKKSNALNRAFEANKDSTAGNFKKGDLLISQAIDSEKMLVGQVYVVHTDARLLFRRLLSKTDENLEFSPGDEKSREILDQKDIIEAWEVIGKYTTELRARKSLEERVALLEEKVSKLELASTMNL